MYHESRLINYRQKSKEAHIYPPLLLFVASIASLQTAGLLQGSYWHFFPNLLHYALMPQAYSRVVSQWAGRDPQAAGDWLNKQPQGPQLDDARRSFATAIAARDPSGAFDWAKAVQDDAKRVAAYEQVYRTLNAKNPASASAALDQAGLPADVAAKVRESVAPKAPEATPK